SGFVLGGPRRRRKFWRRHVVHIQAASDQDRLWRSDALRTERNSRRDEMVSRFDPDGARRSEWLLRLSHCAASSAVPGTSAHEKNVWRCVGVRRATRESRANILADPRLQKACAGSCGAAAAAGVT